MLFPLNPPITKEKIQEAERTLIKYRNAKASLEARLIDNEEWYRLRRADPLLRKDPEEINATSAWLLNSIAGKHADAMDNYPEPFLLPREESDQPDADALSAILPVILEQNDYEEVYSDVWWTKLKGGTGITGVFWNPSRMGGMGDIDIRPIDPLSIYWEPGIKNIQYSKNIFHIESVDNETLLEAWPFLEGKLKGGLITETNYRNTRHETGDRSVVVDWYYKKRVNGRDIVHFVKFVSGELLYASENDERYFERGYYDHGQYPFVFDVQFQEADSPAGFGFIDVCKQPQMYIDKLNSVILKSALMSARPRFFIRSDGSINEEEYADWNNDFVHYQGGSAPTDSLRQIEMRPVSSALIAILNGKIDELKETSGNRDFSQGSSASGVTAAGAIMALQSAGDKLSRDALKSSYRAFTRICHLIIELIRQFYTEPRCFRVMGAENGQKYVYFCNARIRAKGEDAERFYSAPVFDIKIRPQRSSPMAMLQRNELAKEFYALGFFKPENAEQALACIEMMEFEGKTQLIERIRRGLTYDKKIKALYEAAMKNKNPEGTQAN